MIRVLVNGCNGKMGKVLRQYITTTPDIVYTYGIDRNENFSFSDIVLKPDVIIDFSVPEATFQALEYASSHLVPIVIATTGFSESELLKIQEYSEAIPIFQSSNMSYTIHLLHKIVGEMAPFLCDTDIEIIEKHHHSKKDSPSGTAISLANTINESCENRYHYVFNRSDRKEARNKNEIGFSSIRGGNLVGEHSVLFIGEYETIELHHISYARTVFAEGAIRAARFITTQKSGLFHMNDLLH